MSIVFGLFYLAGLLVFARFAQAARAGRGESAGPIPRSSYLWAALPCLTLAFLFVWGLMGLLEGMLTLLVAPATAAVIVTSGLICLRRDEVWSAIGRLGPRTRAHVRSAHLLLTMVLCVLVIEVPFNSWMPFRGPTFAWLELALVTLLMTGLYFLGQRHAGLCVAGVAFFFVAGIGQYFVKRFKNSAILPTDLLVLDTAAAVSKEYVFSLSETALAGIACMCCAFAALALVRPPRGQEGRRPDEGKPGGSVRATTAQNVAWGLASLGLLAALILVPSYMGRLGVEMKYWYSIDYYQMQGFLPSFIAVMQDMPIRKPEGYSARAAAGLTESYAVAWRSAARSDDGRQAASKQFLDTKPSVIAVMNESFADLSVLDGMHAGYKGPQFFLHGLDDALERGTLNVSVHGAGTCNTEFEFLTGNALTFIGVGKYPYSIYDLSDVDALAAEFKQWGYDTCAIHPNHASNWNRHKIYPQMGFDQFLSIDDFGGMANMATDHETPNEPHCEVFHSGVSDKETYNRILQMLEDNESPQFFFDVTMANHGSYNQDNIPEAYRQHYLPQDFEGEETPERLNEYLACIEKSDDDLRDFVSALKAIERPVVLVFFGDHQPSLSASYNDWWYTDEPESVHARRAFCSQYVIWANYDVAGRGQKAHDDEISVDMLAAQTLDLIGAPVSDFQAAQLQIRKTITSLSAADYQTADRVWHAPEAGEEGSDTYHDLSLIEYLNFATKV